ncbi:unnamed protein product, partial [Angiostrongylus costaricensis]|uniref:Uncharacterized protein n=1 Tax=Angiostrongylus costaricensis TaxID=334426 RepID=A0A0R3PIA5_ANGCS
SAKFPTLLPSTRRKVAFRKHTTLTPQTNGTEERSLDPGIFEGETTHVEFAIEAKSNAEKFENHRRNISKKQQMATALSAHTTPTTSSDIEYEIVEIEVDENGNEILNEEAKESVHHKNGQQQGWIEVLKSSEEQSGDDVRRHPRQKSPVKHSLAVTHGNERQERRKLVKEQKRDLNLPDSIEVEYLDNETTTRPTHEEAIDNDDYSNENPQYE